MLIVTTPAAKVMSSVVINRGHNLFLHCIISLLFLLKGGSYAALNPSADLAATAAAVAVVILPELYRAAAVQREVDRRRRLHEICGRRTIVTRAAQDFGNCRVDTCAEYGVLVGLAQLILKLCNLCILAGELFADHEVHDASVVGVLVVDQVTCLHVDDVAKVAQTFRHVEVYAVDCTLRGAAAIGNLVADIAEAAFNAVKALHHAHLRGIEAAVDSVGQRVGTVANALLYAADRAVDVLRGKAVVKLGASQCAVKIASAAAEAAESKAPAPREARIDLKQS